MADYKLGYIDIYRSGSNDFIGGVLIVNRLGIPIEFRHTETVSPSKVQKVLYGQAITRFLKCETLAKCLLEDIENKPDLLVVPDAEYYPLASIFKFPFAQVSNASREPMQQHGDFVEVSETEVHLQVLSMREPLRVRVSKQGVPSMNAIKTILVDVGRTMDVIEPLSRVKEALAALVTESR